MWTTTTSTDALAVEFSPTLEISKIFILKIGQTRPQLVYFRSVHKTDIAQIWLKVMKA